MMRYFYLIVACLSLLAGCAGDNKRSGVPTIGSVQWPKIDWGNTADIPENIPEPTQRYESLLNLAPDSPQYRETLRRLGDLSLEAGERSRAAGNEPDARRQWQLATRHYRDYLENYTEGKQREIVWYQLAKAHDLLGELEQSLAVLGGLLKEFPTGRFSTEANFRRGELSFALRDYATAEKSYEVVTSSTTPSIFYEQALYKYGWALYKQERYVEANTAFLRLLNEQYKKRKIYDDRLADNLSAAEREFIEDTLHVLSLSLISARSSESLTNYFSKHERPPYEPLLYLSLGNLHLRKQGYENAAETFSGFSFQHSNDARAYIFAQRVIDAYQQGNFPSQVVSAKEKFIAVYGINTPYWAAHDENLRAKLRPLLRMHTRDLAQYFHASARRTQNKTDYLRAAQWYGRFVVDFPTDLDAPEMRFFMAEALSEGGQVEEAIAAYEKVAYEDAITRSVEAGYAALLLFDAHEKVLDSTQRTSWRARAMRSALRFADNFADDKRVPIILVKTAEEYFAAHELEQALIIAQRVLGLVPHTAVTTALQFRAWKIYGHAQYERGEYASAEVAYRHLLQHEKMEEAQRSLITERLTVAVYKQGEAIRAQGDMRAAANHFLQAARLAATPQLQATALYDGATALIEARNWREAEKVLQEMRQRKLGDAVLQEGVTEKLASVYLNMRQDNLAAREFELLAELNRTPEQRRLFLWQAAELYVTARLSKDAIRVYERYVALFPLPLAPALEARGLLGDFYLAQGNAPKRTLLLEEIVKVEGGAGAARTPQTRRLGAHALLALTESQRVQYASMKLTIPLDKSLKLKKKAMEGLISGYSRVMDYQIAETTTQATFLLAEVYRFFAQSLLSSDRPRDLEKDALEQYNLLLEQQAFPFEEKAIAIHITNVKRISDNIYDAWVRASLDALAELQPFRYGKMERFEHLYEVAQ